MRNYLIIVRCKQPIKIERPLQCPLRFSYSFGKRNIPQTVFDVIIFSMSSNVIVVVQFMFSGINIFWALLRVHFNPRLMARAKMSLSRARNIFMPANINSIVLLLAYLTDRNNAKEKGACTLRTAMCVELKGDLIQVRGIKFTANRMISILTLPLSNTSLSINFSLYTEDQVLLIYLYVFKLHAVSTNFFLFV